MAAVAADHADAVGEGGGKEVTPGSHSLAQRWSLWVLGQHDGAAGYSSALTRACTFGTAAQLWHAWDKFPLPRCGRLPGALAFVLVRACCVVVAHVRVRSSLCACQHGVQRWAHRETRRSLEQRRCRQQWRAGRQRSCHSRGELMLLC